MISKICQGAKQYQHHTERNLARPHLIIVVHDNSTKYLKAARRKEILTVFSGGKNALIIMPEGYSGGM